MTHFIGLALLTMTIVCVGITGLSVFDVISGAFELNLALFASIHAIWIVTEMMAHSEIPQRNVIMLLLWGSFPIFMILEGVMS